MNSLLFLPLAGVAIGVVGSLTGTGGGLLAVPLLFALGFSKNAAVSSSFVSMLFIVFSSLALYGMKGSVDWKAGALIGVGAVLGSYLAISYIQPIISERTFRYLFAAFLIIVAGVLIMKKS